MQRDTSFWGAPSICVGSVRSLRYAQLQEQFKWIEKSMF